MMSPSASGAGSVGGALSISSVGSSGSSDDEDHDDRRGGGEPSSSSASDDDDDGEGDTFFAPDELDATPGAMTAAKRSGDDEGEGGVVATTHDGVGGDVDKTDDACGGSGDDDDHGGEGGSVGDGGGDDGDGVEGVEVGNRPRDAGRGDDDYDATGDGAPAASAAVETASSSRRDDHHEGGRGRTVAAAKSDEPSIVVRGADDDGGGGGHNDADADGPATVRPCSGSSPRRHDGHRKPPRDVVEIDIGRSVLAWRSRWKNSHHGQRVTDGEESPPEDVGSSPVTTVVTVRHKDPGATMLAPDHGIGGTTTVATATLVLDRDDDSSTAADSSSSSRRATMHYDDPGHTRVDNDDAGGRSAPGASAGDQRGDESGRDEGSSSRRTARRYYVGRASVVAPSHPPPQPSTNTGDASSHGEGKGGKDEVEDGDDGTMVECVAVYDRSRGSYVLEIVDVAVADLEGVGGNDHPDPVTIGKAGVREEKDEYGDDEHVLGAETTGGAVKKVAKGGIIGDEGHDETNNDPLRRTEAAERRVRDLRRRKGKMPSTVTSKVKAKAKAKKSPAKKTAQETTVPKRKKSEPEIKLDREEGGDAGNDAVASADATDGAPSAEAEGGGARNEDADSTANANTNTNPAAASSSSRRTKDDEDGKATRSSPSPSTPAITSGDKKRRQRRRRSPSSAEGETATEEASQRQQSRRGAKSPPSTSASTSTSTSTSTTPRKKPKSGYWGVTTAVSKRAGGRCSYRCQVKLDGRLRYLGTFDSAEEAARRYDAAAYRRGDGALLNFPDDVEATLRLYPVVEGPFAGGAAVTAAADDDDGDEGGANATSPEEG